MRVRGVVALMASLLSAHAAQAWGPEGNSVIARAAAQQLSPQAETDLSCIISEGISALNSTMGRNCPINVADPSGPFVTHGIHDNSTTNLAKWADLNRYIDKTTAGWHFEDILPKEHLTTLLADKPWCSKDGCVSAALATNMRALNERGLAPESAARALADVIHLTGDLHQPRHAEDNDDVGGNDVLVTTTASGVSAVKLRATRDTALVVSALGKDWNHGVSEVEQDLVEGAHSCPIPTVSVEDLVAQSGAWIAASHELAHDAHGKLIPPPALDQGTVQNVTVTPAYVAAEAFVVRTQIDCAALRARAILTAALVWAPPG